MIKIGLSTNKIEKYVENAGFQEDSREKMGFPRGNSGATTYIFASNSQHSHSITPSQAGNWQNNAAKYYL